MTRLISLREMGKLHYWITQKDKQRESKPVKKEISNEEPSPGKDTGTWLKADLPALSGPHQNRPWVQLLRMLAHGVLEV